MVHTKIEDGGICSLINSSKTERRSSQENEGPSPMGSKIETPLLPLAKRFLTWDVYFFKSIDKSGFNGVNTEVHKSVKPLLRLNTFFSVAIFNAPFKTGMLTRLFH